MSTKCAITQPDQLPILRKPAASKIHDPIFKRRKHAYSREEWSYISSLVPLDALPPSLRSSPRNRQPPKMHFGWIINETTKARLLEKAHQNPECLVEEETSVDEDPECIELNCPPGLHTHIDEYMTMDAAAELVYQELGIVLPRRDYVDAVWSANESLDLCLTLYTNYELAKPLPSKDDIGRISQHLGLDGNPQWWPSLHFEWYKI